MATDHRIEVIEAVDLQSLRGPRTIQATMFAMHEGEEISLSVSGDDPDTLLKMLFLKAKDESFPLPPEDHEIPVQMGIKEREWRFR